MATPKSEIIVNKTRIQDADGFVGTVRYIGPVASAKKQTEVYAGIEWDDHTRGKHDGSVISKSTNELVRHFSLKSKSTTGGSFLKVSKLDTGIVLNLDTVRLRYVDSDAPLVAPNNILPYSARTSSGRSKPIEFLGEMKVRKRQQLDELIDISLRSMAISSVAAGEEREELKRTFEHLKEIDLAGNLFSDWNDLFHVLETFGNLEWLSFASNKIYDLPINADGLCFDKLRVLNLNKCAIESFDTVEKLDKICPNLQELCVAFSDLSDMTNAETKNEALSGFQHLTLLDCSSCNLTSWSRHVHRLSSLPNLKTLILDDNALEQVDIVSDQDFPSLVNLQIAGTNIDKWQQMESLSALMNLEILRFRKCPLTDELGAGESRAGTIARLPNINVLNASQISEKERMEAERRYVSSVSREMVQLTSKSRNSEKSSGESIEGIIESFKILGLNEKYSRFESLVTKHKETMLMMAAVNSSGGAISNSSINVTIKSMAAESCTSEPLQKRLPSSLTVGRLKTMLSRAFGLDVDLQILQYRNEGSDFPAPMDDDENALAFYGLSDGAEILMNEVDVKAQKAEDEKKKAIRLQSIEEQEKRSNIINNVRQNEVKAHAAAAENASKSVTNAYAN